MTTPTILHIAVPTPLHRTFDYLLPAEYKAELLQPGVRVEIPFGRQKVIGVLIAIDQSTNLPLAKLKLALRVLDEQPIVFPLLMKLCLWASDYYHYPIGEVMSAALPALLRQGEKAQISGEFFYRLTESGKAVDINQFKRAPKQATLLHLLQQQLEGISYAQIKEYNVSSAILSALKKKDLVECFETTVLPVSSSTSLPLNLNLEQQYAVGKITEKLQQFASFLLYGVTGSGKTEVYLQTIAQVLQKNLQALVIVPEIGLTPQTVARFQTRFSVPVVAMHSALGDRERLNAWLMAANGMAKIIIGTRSAIFTPLQALGIIIIDEEHDLSLKQQDGFRYSARDLALVRARLESVPVLLGSATPSLESLYNAEIGRYQLLTLPERAGSAIHPHYHLVDIRSQKLHEGLSTTLLLAIEKHLNNKGQILIFLNRRGFAPILMCHSCGWIAVCSRCDARLVLHRQAQYLSCHHCGSQKKIYSACPSCEASELFSIGVGTQRLEETLKQHFPQTPITRIDRDSMRRKEAFDEALENILQGEPQILIGTQMLAKGHHFPDVTLVAIIDADYGFFSADFRAMERMGQLLLQVAGRAGRAEKSGEVYIQTHYPTHPSLQLLIQEGYWQFAKLLLQERQLTHFPPFSYLVLLRAEATVKEKPKSFLNEIKRIVQKTKTTSVSVLGPVPAPMARRAGHYRSQLLLMAEQRQPLHEVIKVIIDKTEQLKLAKQIRWSIDIDPQEV